MDWLFCFLDSHQHHYQLGDVCAELCSCSDLQEVKETNYATLQDQEAPDQIRNVPKEPVRIHRVSPEIHSLLVACRRKSSEAFFELQTVQQ